MDNQISFKIGSAFDGEGFTAANKAIKENRQELQSSVHGLGELTKAISDVSPEAATAVNSVKSFAAAFTTGGIVGGVIQLAIEGIGVAVKAVVEHFEAASEATRKYAEILKSQFVDSINASKTKFSELVDAEKQANQEAEDLLKVLNGDLAHEAKNKIFELHTEAMQAMVDDTTEAGRALITETEKYKTSLVNAQLAIDQTANVIETRREEMDNALATEKAAHDRVATATQALADLQEQCSPYLEKRKQIEDTLTTQEERFNEGQISLTEILGVRKEASLAIKNLEENYKLDIDSLKDATNNLAQAQKDEATAERNAQVAKDNLRAAVQANEEAVKEFTLKEKEGAQKLEEAQQKVSESADEIQEARAAQAMKAEEEAQKIEDLNAAADKLAKARNDNADRLNDADKDTDKGKDGKGGKKVHVENANEIGLSVGTNVKIDGVREDINKPKHLDDDTWQRYQDGTANVADIDRVERFKKWDDDTRFFSELNRVKADLGKFFNLAPQPKSWLNDRDKDFANTFKTDVLPQLPKDLAEKLIGTTSEKLLIPSTFKEAMKDKEVVKAWLDSLKLK